MDNLNVIPETITREDHYLKFLAVGGDINLLPEPVSRRDNFLYAMCLNGGNIGVSSKRVNGFYRCLLNSDSGAYNFCSTILDLGETKRVTIAKVKARFILRNSSATLPVKLGFRLFANNSAGRNVIAGYNVTNDGIVAQADQIVGNKEYVLEAEFTAQGGQTNGQPNLLNTCRYLKPFITLTKQSSNDNQRQEKNLIEVYEVTIEADGVIYDITDTVCDFVPKDGSKITYVEGVLSEQASMIRNGKWLGKTVACMGDSITFGYKSGAGDGNLAEDNPWASQLRDYCGFTNIRNYGITGSTVAQYQTKNPMHSRVGNMDVNADVIVFMGGTNDLSNGTPIGALKENDSQLANNNFYEALQICIKTLKERYPNKPIVVMTPINGSNNNIPNNTNPRTRLTMEDYRKAIREVAKFYGVYLFDLQNALPFDALNDPQNTYFAQNDKVHPNQAGHDEMAKVISKFINEIA